MHVHRYGTESRFLYDIHDVDTQVVNRLKSMAAISRAATDLAKIIYVEPRNLFPSTTIALYSLASRSKNLWAKNWTIRVGQVDIELL